MKANVRLGLLILILVLIVAGWALFSYSSVSSQSNVGSSADESFKRSSQLFLWNVNESNELHPRRRPFDTVKPGPNFEGPNPGSGGGGRERELAQAIVPEQEVDVPATTSCRNTVQGRSLIADDLGWVCDRKILKSTGCCPAGGLTGQDADERYSCRNCHPSTGCCSVYEHCVSCCLHPQNKIALMSVLKEATRENNILLLSATDQFELCQAKCRTNSRSVRHENVYLDSELKYCFKSLEKGVKGSVSSDILKSSIRPNANDTGRKGDDLAD